jgi:uncharacterized protein YggU (UPF0235/DUF167 family)
MPASPSTQLEVRVLADRHRSHLIGATIVDVVDDVLRIRVVDVDHRGVNDQLIDSLADALAVDPGAISIIRGRHSAAKLLAIDGLSDRDLDAMLAVLVPVAEVPQPDELPVDYHDNK